MTGRLDNLKTLNADRWKAHAQCQTNAAGGAGGGGDDDNDARDCEQLLASVPVASTGGALFNLPNSAHDGELTWIDPKTHERVPKPSGSGMDWMRTRVAVPSSGDDWSSVSLGSAHKYRIPPTSVTRKMGKCRLFGCCGWRLTAVSCNAQPAHLPSPLQFYTPHLAHLLTHRRSGSGCSTWCASARTRPWSSSRSGWPTGGTGEAPSTTRST